MRDYLIDYKNETLKAINALENNDINKFEKCIKEREKLIENIKFINDDEKKSNENIISDIKEAQRRLDGISKKIKNEIKSELVKIRNEKDVTKYTSFNETQKIKKILDKKY